MWLGDYTEDHATVTCMFTTHSSTGAPVAPLSAFEAADVIIYKNGSGTQKTTTNGVTMTSPFDSITGLHCLVIDTSNDTGDTGFWVAGAVYTLVLSPDSETVDGVTVAKVIGQFGIELAGALRPTTASRKLDVSTGGEAGIDWANIGSPTTTQNLSGTTVATTQKVDVDTIKTNPVVNGGTITFPTGATLASTTNITAGTITTATNVTTVNGLAAGVITTTSIADDAITAAKIANGAIDAATFASGALDAVWSTGTRVLTAGTNIQLPSNGLANVTAWTVAITGNITGNLSGSVGSVTGLTASNLDVAVSTRLAAADYDSASATADAVWSASRDATLNSLTIQNNGSGPAVRITSTDDHGMLIEAGYLSNHDGLKITGVNGGHGIYAVGGDSGAGMKLQKGAGAAYDLLADDISSNILSMQDDIESILEDTVSSGVVVDVVAIANEVETRTLMADIRKVNNVTITGAGIEGADEWRPA